MLIRSILVKSTIMTIFLYVWPFLCYIFVGSPFDLTFLLVLAGTTAIFIIYYVFGFLSKPLTDDYDYLMIITIFEENLKEERYVERLSNFRIYF